LVDPETEQIYHANPNRVWAFSPKSMKKLLKDGKLHKNIFTVSAILGVELHYGIGSCATACEEVKD
jgi:hypothetical protein